MRSKFCQRTIGKTAVENTKDSKREAALCVLFMENQLVTY